MRARKRRLCGPISAQIAAGSRPKPQNARPLPVHAPPRMTLRFLFHRFPVFGGGLPQRAAPAKSAALRRHSPRLRQTPETELPATQGKAVEKYPSPHCRASFRKPLCGDAGREASSGCTGRTCRIRFSRRPRCRKSAMRHQHPVRLHAPGHDESDKKAEIPLQRY